jgi:hypothetical protein
MIPRMESSAYFLDKAEQCRRLARTIYRRDDPAIKVLLDLAAEFDAKAIEAAIRESNAFVRRTAGGTDATADICGTRSRLDIPMGTSTFRNLAHWTPSDGHSLRALPPEGAH